MSSDLNWKVAGKYGKLKGNTVSGRKNKNSYLIWRVTGNMKKASIIWELEGRVKVLVEWKSINSFKICGE